MAAQAPAAHDVTGRLDTDLASFKRHLRAENKAPLTVHTYGKAVDSLASFIERQGMPPNPRHLRREHLEAYLVHLQDRGHKPATVAQRFRSLQQFFKWLKEEEEIPET